MDQEQNLEQKSREELLALAREQRAALTTYKETLSRIYSEFDAKIEELSLIRRVSDVLRQAEDLKGLCLSLAEVVIGELPADFASLMLTDPEMTRLRPIALMARDWDAPRPVESPDEAQSLGLDEGPLGQAVSRGSILALPEMTPAEVAPWPADLPAGARSLLALPLVAREQTLGAMVLVSQTPQALGQEQARALTIICDHAASALVNVRLIEQLGEINQRLLASELEAHQAREYLQHLLDTATDVILIAGSDGGITYANQAAAELGLAKDQLLGRSMASLFSDPARAGMIVSSPLRHNEELELAGPEGQARLVLMSTTPLSDTGEVLAILRDITRRRALERQLMHAEKLASVGILAAGVAHEIGNPLSAISGYAQLLGKAKVEDAQRTEFAGAIGSQAERINKIIRDLLEYSRPSPYQGQAVDANAAIESVLDMFFTQKRLASHKLVIERKLSEAALRVILDRDQLMQVALNLVMNAAQAMEGGGELTISTGLEKGVVRIDFADTGPGIPAEHLPLIFDPFFSTKPVGQGTGLGLSICQRIASQAGGRIQARNRPGGGALFTVWLPAADSAIDKV